MKKRRVVVTAEAVRDLEEIDAYVSADSPRPAMLLILRLRRAVDELDVAALHYPVIMQRGDDPVRRRAVGSYNIIYWLTEDTVEIVHVVHSARNLQAILNPGED